MEQAHKEPFLLPNWRGTCGCGDHKLVCLTYRQLGDPFAYSEWKLKREHATDPLDVMDCWRSYAATKRDWNPITRPKIDLSGG